VTKTRKPEWTPANAGKEFASRIMEPSQAHGNVSKHDSSSSRRKTPSTDDLETGIRQGDRTLLAKAITLIESNSSKHFDQAQELIRRLLPESGNSVRIGVTGVPGSGKSTLIENLGVWLIEKGHKVAVLAIDPSSSLSKGSILGDKTRMEELSRSTDSFIRPSPSGGTLGGVARKTRETIILCEAAGYDIILIETVGVGQSEVTVRSMVDFFLLLQISGAGDELQGIKKGIMELADLVLVNKADGDNVPAAELACGELNNALHYLRPATPGWMTTAITCSALKKQGLSEIWERTEAFVKQGRGNGSFAKRRQTQVTQWFEALLTESVLNRFYADPKIHERLPGIRNEVESGHLPVLLALEELFKGI
jgi:LAO/AO transport system kinase